MRLKIIGCLVVLAEVAALAFTTTAPAAPNAANGKGIPAAAAGLPSPAAASPESHPEIREAIGSLRRAKEHMEHAAHDFGGHRVEAIHATDAAIHQLEECLRYDRD
jgi:hypothetical protein